MTITKTLARVPMITTIPGVTVSLDETGDMPRLVVTIPKGTKLPAAFVRLCHDTAGNHGATIEWRAA